MTEEKEPDLMIPNWSTCNVFHVVIQAIRFTDEDGVLMYKPCVSVFLNEDRENSIAISLVTDKLFDSPERLAIFMTSWCAKVFTSISRRVTVIDADEGVVLYKLDVHDILELEHAESELKRIMRENINLIH